MTQQPEWSGPPARPPHRGGTVVIALVTAGVGLLAAVGLVFLFFGDTFDEFVELVQYPLGDSGPGGTVDLGNGVSVTAPDGWAVEQRERGSIRIERGRSMVLGSSDTGRRQSPAELCDNQIRSMAGHGIADPTYTDAVTVKSADGAVAVQCEVTGTATGSLGSGPTGIRTVVAGSESDGVTARLSLYFHPGSTRDETFRDFTAMTDSLWSTLTD